MKSVWIIVIILNGDLLIAYELIRRLSTPKVPTMKLFELFEILNYLSYLRFELYEILMASLSQYKLYSVPWEGSIESPVRPPNCFFWVIWCPVRGPDCLFWDAEASLSQHKLYSVPWTAQIVPWIGPIIFDMKLECPVNGPNIVSSYIESRESAQLFLIWS